MEALVVFFFFFFFVVVDAHAILVPPPFPTIDRGRYNFVPDIMEKRGAVRPEHLALAEVRWFVGHLVGRGGCLWIRVDPEVWALTFVAHARSYDQSFSEAGKLRYGGVVGDAAVDGSMLIFKVGGALQWPNWVLPECRLSVSFGDKKKNTNSRLARPTKAEEAEVEDFASRDPYVTTNLVTSYEVCFPDSLFGGGDATNECKSSNACCCHLLPCLQIKPWTVVVGYDMDNQ